MAKRTHSDGKAFENFVKMIQMAYKDLPDTEILSDVKLPDEQGGKGQIDVLVRIKSNGFTLTIAIECKDYGKPVGKEKVDAFYAKCDAIKEVDKMVFVSRSGYQAGAINSAKYRGIELYNIEEVTIGLFRSWVDVDSFRQIQVEGISNVEFIVYFDNGKSWTGFKIPLDAVAILPIGLIRFSDYIKQCFDQIKSIATLAISHIVADNYDHYLNNSNKVLEEKVGFRAEIEDDFRIGFTVGSQRHHTAKLDYIEFFIWINFILYRSDEVTGKEYKGIVRASNQADILQIKLKKYQLNIIKSDQIEDVKFFQIDSSNAIKELKIIKAIDEKK